MPFTATHPGGGGNAIPLIPQNTVRKRTPCDFQSMLPPIDDIVGPKPNGSGGSNGSAQNRVSPTNQRDGVGPDSLKLTFPLTPISGSGSSGSSGSGSSSQTESVDDGLSDLERHKLKVKPWWIGQRIVCETEQRVKLTATIKDYFESTKSVQLWYDNEESTFETVQLDKLLNWTVADTLRISEYHTLNGGTGKRKKGKGRQFKIIDFIPRQNGWRPLNLEMLQRVKVLYRDGQWYTAFVDGYDPISRRHHINYGDTAEWLWATKDRIKPVRFKIADHAEALRSQIESNQHFAAPPPWDPEPYGLDGEFERVSLRMDGDESPSPEPVRLNAVCFCVNALKPLSIQFESIELQFESI